MQPLKPNTTQISRVKKCQIGEGFFIFHCEPRAIQAIEFRISDDQMMTNPDGSPLEYKLDNGRVTYRVENKASIT